MITPYFQNGRATIYLGDCREIYPQIAKADVIIADPPYAETRQKWDRWPKGWLTPAARAGSLWCFGTFRMFRDHHEEFAAFHLAQDLIWEKQNGSGMHADRFRKVHEMLVQFYPKGTPWGSVYKHAIRIPTGKPKRIIRHSKPVHWGQVSKGVYEVGTMRLMRSVIRARNGHRSGGHANAKPVPILRALIEYSCPPTGTVVEFFMGGGTGLIAALEAGRNAIGIDGDEKACEIAAKAISQAHLPI